MAATLVVVCTMLLTLLARTKVRLRVTDGGLVVTGPIHRREIAWDRIAQISTPRRGRFGRTGATLELEVLSEDSVIPCGDCDQYDGYDAIPGEATLPNKPLGPAQWGADAPDTELMTFGSFELGTDPADVGRALLRLRADAL